ncbi:MAG: radical SAM protein [Anaerolineales bacterium]|nr:radical SAM protein [Anaerolineales bacterium]
MKTALTAETLPVVRNPVFRQYAARYVNGYARFAEQVRGLGLDFETPEAAAQTAAETAERLARLRGQAVLFRNDDKSLVLNRLSPACEACQTGVGSATFFISLQCHRSCYYCFNPNQENYEYFRDNQRDLTAELDAIRARGLRLRHVALTGGEPLLHKPQAVAFFDHARRSFPEAHRRLYTCGDYVDAEILQQLQAAGLDEIRLSIRMHDLDKGHRHVFERLALAQRFISTVMVEMPVLPGTEASMRDVLLELDRLGIHSINLLEFCFPLFNAPEFAARGFRIKSPPYRVLYNYWYAGGLPVAGSEVLCLALLEFAREQGLRLGVHYCSLENKHTGQIYQQNNERPAPAPYTFSARDYFLKSAKVFGRDIVPARRALQRAGAAHFERNHDYDYLEFPVQQIPALRDLDVEVGLSSNVAEAQAGERFLRELQVELTRPREFDLVADI